VTPQTSLSTRGNLREKRERRAPDGEPGAHAVPREPVTSGRGEESCPGPAPGSSPCFGFGVLALGLESERSIEPVVSLLDPLFLCMAFLLAFAHHLDLLGAVGGRVEGARTGAPYRRWERSLELGPAAVDDLVLSSTVSVMRSPWRELITTLLPSGSTLDTRPTADFRLAELLAEALAVHGAARPGGPVELVARGAALARAAGAGAAGARAALGHRSGRWNRCRSGR